ncbi:MAG TPA: CUAEP/CCAEP-tail radical SAM protein [Methylomirabilota bacterium]|nr:CUAEP/CCAEP-tail radical SAM protein [Methylomirabilota bacterium]
MHDPGDVLLIACYELGHQPLALAWPAAFLERAGLAPAVMDLSVEPFDAEKVARARVVAISVPMHTALRLGVQAAERVRTVNPAARLVFYGLYAALNAEYLRARCGADAVLSGELEDELVTSVVHLLAGMPPAPRETSLDRLAFPTPSRSALPSLEKYAHVDRDGRLELAAYVEASRGCKHRCRHCPIPPVYGGRFFVVPVDVVLADVRQQVAAGARHVTFGDPDFLNGPRHALAVARALHAQFPDVTFDMTAKVEHLLRHREHLPALAAFGCLFVVTAAESLDDDVLRHLDKDHTRADIERALAALRAASISPRPTWVAFTPWTTLDGYREWLDFIARERLVDCIDPVQYGIRLLVPPGSLLAGHEALRPFLGPLVEGAFHYRWAHPDPRVDRLQADVAATVAAAAGREDAATTFDHVRGLAARAAGQPSPPSLSLAADRRRPPRLTEAWFC